MDKQRIFKKMCLIRHFEYELLKAYEQKRIPGVIYLSIGQEAPSATLSGLTPG